LTPARASGAATVKAPAKALKVRIANVIDLNFIVI
jgi:hypothetical protein